MSNENNTSGKLPIELKSGASNSFFLENILKARVALNLATGRREENDEDTNVYLAGLLNGLTFGGSCIAEKPYLSPYDEDVRHYLDQHPGSSSEFIVYKDNADFGLVSLSVFLGYDHAGSYHRRVLGDVDESGRIACYYLFAANALAHIKSGHALLVHTFHSLAEHIGEAVRIVRKVAGDYFDMMERITDGSLFHLEREVDDLANRRRFTEAMDEFLKAFSEYKAAPSLAGREKVTSFVTYLKALDPRFSFDESQL
jgi:hypothetical protein